MLRSIEYFRNNFERLFRNDYSDYAMNYSEILSIYDIANCNGRDISYASGSKFLLF